MNPPIGCTQFINPNQETKLIIKEKVMSITGDAFDIKIDPQNGQPPQPIFKVDPSWITSRKSFHDMNGNHLFDVKKEHFHLVHKYFKAVDPSGTKFFEIKSGFSREYRRSHWLSARDVSSIAHLILVGTPPPPPTDKLANPASQWSAPRPRQPSHPPQAARRRRSR